MSDSEGYEEVGEPIDAPACTYVNIFDSETFSSKESLDAYNLEAYGCNITDVFTNISPSRGTDFYEWCRLVTYCRRSPTTGKNLVNLLLALDSTSDIWTDDSLLEAMLEDDELLMSFVAEEESYDGGIDMVTAEDFPVEP